MEYSGSKIFNSFGRVWYQYVKTLIIIYLSSSLFACTSIRNIEIETSVSPDYPISEDVQSLALLNRCMNRQFSNIQSDSLEKILINNRLELDSVFRDSISADTVIHVAAHALFDSGRFDVVIPEAHNIDRDDYENILSPLSIGDINGICKDFNVEAVLTLESFEENLITKYYSRPFEVSYSDNYGATTDVKYKSEWRLYRPGDSKPAIRFQISDTIYWKNSSNSINDLYAQMPKTKEALIGGGIASALKMVGYIAPKWVVHTRHYFMTGNSEIDKAVPLIKENKWDEAATIWTKYTGVSSKRIRSKVEFNLALSAEMNGDLDLAIEWGLKSFKTSYSSTAEEYLRVLDANRKLKQKGSTQSY